MITVANAQEQKNAPKIIILLLYPILSAVKWIPHEEQDEKTWIIIIIIYKQYQLNSKEETLKIKNKFMDDHMISILFCDCTDGSVG